jgi:pimeloyl-ACP methyl ester carboxylesterase
MLQLSKDHTFHYELLRVLATARGFGADVGEVLNVAEKIIPGEFESWYKEFYTLAEHVNTTEVKKQHPVSARNAMFRAANYYRSADFFLHGNPADPRIKEIWKKQTHCFDQAIALMDIPGERLLLKGEGFNVPAIFFRAANDGKPRPTLLIVSGYDGSQEELLHAFGFEALQRGFNVITFEGPGQPTVMRDQEIGFITEYEKVVTPVVNYCSTKNEIDASKIALLGYSLGGFLVARAAAFEHRLAAVVCVDGVYNVYKAFTENLPDTFKELIKAKNADGLNKATAAGMQHDTNFRWAVQQGCWAFKADSVYDFLQKTKSMTLENVADNVKCPILVCEAADDRFFEGQPQMLVNKLGDNAVHKILTAEDAAGSHCHVGATDIINSVVMDWLEELFN